MNPLTFTLILRIAGALSTQQSMAAVRPHLASNLTDKLFPFKYLIQHDGRCGISKILPITASSVNAAN